MSSAAHAKLRKVIYTEHLIKVLRTNMESFQKILNVKTHKGVRTDNPKLTSNFGTGDKMLRYKRIRFFFFMDTFLCDK